MDIEDEDNGMLKNNSQVSGALKCMGLINDQKKKQIREIALILIRKKKQIKEKQWVPFKMCCI